MTIVSVMGCGPAGLFAAHAAKLAGCNVQLYSFKTKSPLYGAQFLHEPIPGTPSADESPVSVLYSLRGSEDGYRRKVYGQQWDGRVSPIRFSGAVPAWDIRRTYDSLWTDYSDRIMDVTIEPLGVRMLLEKSDLVINSLPRPAICWRDSDCSFQSRDVMAAGDAPDIGISVSSLYPSPDNAVICNGDESPYWYRKSRVFGHTTVEWPYDPVIKYPVKTASVVRKPLRHTCKCWQDEDRLIHVGRYGTWEKGVLSHEAFKTVAGALM